MASCVAETPKAVRDNRTFRGVGKHLADLEDIVEVDSAWKISRGIMLGQDGIRGLCPYSRLDCIVFYLVTVRIFCIPGTMLKGPTPLQSENSGACQLDLI